MEFIIVLVSAMVFRNSHFLASFQSDGWFRSVRETLGGISLPDNFQLWASLLLPVLLLLLVLNALDGVLLGLFEFIISLLVIFYSLGRFDFDNVSQRYRSSLERGDTQGALSDLQEAGYAEPVDDLVGLHYSFEYEFSYNEFQRWFSVVFLYLLLGPVAAFLYRLLRMVGSESEQASYLLGILEWLPVRLLGLSWALVGNFDDMSVRWEDALEHGLDSAASVSAFTSTELPPDLSAAQASERCQQLQTMFRRSVILWVIFAALIALFV